MFSTAWVSGQMPQGQELWLPYTVVILVRANAGAIPMISYLPSSVSNDTILDDKPILFCTHNSNISVYYSCSLVVLLYI